jgi:dihydrofolate reductase
MPELFADMFISVDGSALGTRSPGYFGYYGPDLEQWIKEQQARPHRDIMGRKTYETLDALPDQHRDESWEVMTKQPSIVFSRTLTQTDWPGVELSAEDAIDEVRRLKETGVSDLRTVGSLSLVQQFLNAGLVDHLRLMIFPLVIGETGERPMFERVGDFELHLDGQSVLDDRIVLLDYRPGGKPPYTD